MRRKGLYISWTSDGNHNQNQCIYAYPLWALAKQKYAQDFIYTYRKIKGLLENHFIKKKFFFLIRETEIFSF